VIKRALIGTGKMGAVFLSSLLDEKEKSELYLFNRTKEKAERVALEVGKKVAKVVVCSSLEELPEVDEVILAIKPQDFVNFSVLISEKAPHLKTSIWISLLAGVTLKTLHERIGGRAVVRVMPTMSMNVGRGVTLLCVSEDFLKEAQSIQLFKRISTSYWCSSEEELERLTPLSACSMAFLAYYLQGYEKWFDQFSDGKVPRQILVESLQASLDLLRNTENYGELIEKVASKKGVTRAGLDCFERNNLHSLIRESIDCAGERGLEMGSIIT